MDKDYVTKLSFSELRDILISINPLDTNHIKRVNEAEASFWKLSSGSRYDDSTNILGFDCGGQQLVFEVCFPIGSLNDATGKDIDFVKRLLTIAENAGLEGSVVVNKVKDLPIGHGYNALTEEYGDMIAFGVIDPVKVTRFALSNAASIASMILTTESLVAEKPEKKAAAGGGDHHHHDEY